MRKQFIEDEEKQKPEYCKVHPGESRQSEAT